MSSYANTYVQNLYSSHHQFTPQQYQDCLITPQPTYPTDADLATYDSEAIYSQVLAHLQHQTNACMSDQYYTSQPKIRVETSTPLPLLPPDFDGRSDSVVSALTPGVDDWQMYQTSMGGPAASTHRSLERARSHQRTPSASTVGSNGPASPYTANISFPQIANTEYSPNSPVYYADQTATFAKNLPTPQQTPTDSLFMSAGYIPTHSAHTADAHLAMKGFAIDHHTSDDFPPDFYQSSRQSMSSHDSPATPQSGAGDSGDYKNVNMSQTDFRQPNANVQLYRTESQAYQDELYNPSSAYSSTPAPAKKRQSEYLTPHRNLVSERLQTANLARSASPTSAVSRDRSPFRDGSPLAPASGWKSPKAQTVGQTVGTAAGMRQQQKEEAEQAEYAQHVPQLRREPTKTISPKDALLDYNETDQPSLFQDNVPAGYRQHNGGADSWQTNFAGSTFGSLSVSGPNMPMITPFRATPADGYQEANYSFMPLPPAQHEQGQIPGTSFQASYAVPGIHYPETNPEFPAHLTTMESSVSEGGPPASSQDSLNASTAPQRPSDTRANTGTYTCTYHGCTQRFDSHVNLQKHKRDFHRSQQHKDTSSAGTDSASPRSSESPAPSTSGMTSAAIMARNSQAGPHKCTRINPSTNKPCNTIFSRPYDLTRHEDTIHNNRKQKVRCPMCREEKTFSRNDALTRHMRVVHPEVEAFGKRRRGD